VVVIFEGLITSGDFEQKLAPLLDSPRFTRAPLSLFDASELTGIEADSSIIRQVARRATARVDETAAADSRMAVVATNDEAFGLARMYEMLRGDTPVEINVVRSLREAEDWLGLPKGYAAELEEVELG